MKTIAELRELDTWLAGFANLAEARRALQAEILVLGTREEFPATGRVFFYVGPCGKIYRAEQPWEN
ncbi:MAG TPA: hypothetical protein VEJ46_14030 [Candidatus Acidoferrum sp.]|nr:hypothetical protein [Candidatus Acidoferrum sp.]